MSKIKTLLWAMRHPVFAFHWLRHKQPYPYLAASIALAILGAAFWATLVGCASFNARTFRTEKAIGDTARGAVHAWNQYIAVASNQVSQAECVKLMAAQTQIYDASRKLGATLQVVENLRLNYATNSANTNLTALQAALEAATSQSAGIVQLVQTFLK